MRGQQTGLFQIRTCHAIRSHPTASGCPWGQSDEVFRDRHNWRIWVMTALALHVHTRSSASRLKNLQAPQEVLWENKSETCLRERVCPPDEVQLLDLIVVEKAIKYYLEWQVSYCFKKIFTHVVRETLQSYSGRSRRSCEVSVSHMMWTQPPAVCINIIIWWSGSFFVYHQTRAKGSRVKSVFPGCWKPSRAPWEY